MKTVFYLLALLPIMWEFICLTDPNRIYKGVQRMKDRKWEDFTTNMKAASLFMTFYFIWALIGLFSFNWPLFVILIVLSLIPKKIKFIRIMDALLSLLILIFIIINAMHLKLNTNDFLNPIG